MKTNVFVKTKNVKGFVALMSELENLPLKIPKIALVTGDFGLGKSETIKWWSFKNDCIYVRANQGMSSRWLLSEIADETVDLKSLGIRGTDKQKMTDMLYQCYGLKDNT